MRVPSGGTDGRFDVAVVGGGITGLAAAHRVRELGRERGRTFRFRLLEGGDRLGGNIRTERRDGLLLEGGPDQFVHHKPAALELCRQLGLGDEVVEIDARRTATHVVHRGRPIRLPDCFTLMGPSRVLPLVRSPLFSWRGVLRMACEPLVRPRPDGVEDESLRAFVTRRFGREVHDRVLEPIMGGIFTADTDRLGLDMTVPQLLEMERRHGSIVRALRGRAAAPREPRGGCMSLRGGLGRLVERLAEELPAGSARTGCRVEHASFDERVGCWRLAIAGGGAIEADTVVLACPGPVSARLLAWDEALSREIARVEYASCATVNLVYPERAVGEPPDNFGCFVGRAERLPILACSHVSVKFPDRVPDGKVLFRAFLGGARDPGILDLDQGELVRVAHRTVAGLLRIEGEPSFARASRFPSSMPQFDVGFRARMSDIAERVRRHPGIFLAGGLAGAIGLPDCISSGRAAAAQALEHLASRGRRPDVAASRA